nr:hypothetical protein [uncultured Trichococcus sp.]
MTLLTKLQDSQKKLYKKKITSFFHNDYENQRELLSSFPEPLSLMDRSFFQYICQMSSIPVLVRITQNIIALPLLFFYMLKPYKKLNTTKGKEEGSAVFLREGLTVKAIPESLKNEFSDIYECALKGNLFMDNNDKRIAFRSMLKYWKSPYFILKCIIKMSIYSNVIHIYKPKAIITHNEYSFASSFLTMYCRLNNVEHINVMHGEKLFNIRDAFVQYDRFYIWDKHYQDLLIQLQAEESQFMVEIPKDLYFDMEKQEEYKYVLTYYLGGEDEIELLSIYRNLSNLNTSLDKICIRYHPRYSNIETIKKVFYNCVIEDPNIVELSKSLSITKYVASLYSTVLFQAYVNGKKVVINDLSSPEKFESLSELNYIMMNKPYIKLSELLIV